MSLLRLLWSGYKNIQSKYPLLTASLSSGTIVSLADGSAQAIEGNGWNKRRFYCLIYPFLSIYINNNIEQLECYAMDLYLLALLLIHGLIFFIK